MRDSYLIIPVIPSLFCAASATVQLSIARRLVSPASSVVIIEYSL